MNFYAMEMARRLHAMSVSKYRGLTRKSGKRTIWNGVVREDSDALSIPLSWRKPRKIFVNSMSDLFHERVSDAFVLKVWDVMRATPHHHYQILTKRPERMGSLVSSKIADILPNVWLGTSVENSDVVDRVDHLRKVPAAKGHYATVCVCRGVLYLRNFFLAGVSKERRPRTVTERLRPLGVSPRRLSTLEGMMSNANWLSTAERIVFEAFKNCAPYVSPFSINNPDGWRYWLIHFANSYRARPEYNNILHDNKTAQAHFGRSGLSMLSYDTAQEGALYLFDEQGRQEAHKQLYDDIPRLVTNFGDAISLRDLYRTIYNKRQLTWMTFTRS
jgi:Protein of unknown function (DUF5131)